MPEPELDFLHSSLLHCYHEYRHKLFKCVTWWCTVMSQCHRIEVETIDEEFEAPREQCFLWERGTPSDADFGLFNFQDFFHIHKNLYWQKGKKLKEHNRSPWTDYRAVRRVPPGENLAGQVESVSRCEPSKWWIRLMMWPPALQLTFSTQGKSQHITQHPYPKIWAEKYEAYSIKPGRRPNL